MNTFAPILSQIREINQCPQGFLPLHAPIFNGHEKDYVLDTIDSTFVSSVGEYVNRFEAMLAQCTGTRKAVACANGTAALQVALHLVGVGHGDLVITQSLSFVATANAIAHTGALPVFVDVEAESLGLCPEALQAFLEQECAPGENGPVHKTSGKRIAACVPMHTFGLPCQIRALAALCETWNIALVEDAAEALGSLYEGQHCGSFGRIGSLSFNGNKIITTGGGGALISNDEELANRAKHLTTTAKLAHRWEFRHDECAWNYRMPNLNAALGCAQLERLDSFVDYKRKLAEGYKALFAQTPWHFVQEAPNTRSNYWLCAVRFADRTERNAFLEASNDSGIMTRPTWEPLHSLPMYAACPRGPLPVTHSVADTLVNLPSGVRLP